jgi:hypothetical protein
MLTNRAAAVQWINFTVSSIPGVLFSLVEELQAVADNALRNDRN